MLFSTLFYSDPKKQLFKFVKHGTSSSVDLYNPCKSPFENDCDENAECIGVNNNKWFSLRQNVFGGKNQYGLLQLHEGIILFSHVTAKKF